MMNRGWFLRRLCRPIGLTVCLAAVGLLVGAGNRAAAQVGQGKYLEQAGEKLARLVNKANEDGYRLASNKFSLGGSWLNQSKSDWVKLFTINMEAGKKYRLLAAGDKDAEDVDLRVTDMEGNVLKKDTARAATAEVDFTPKKTQRYMVELRLYASTNNRPSLTIATVMVRK